MSNEVSNGTGVSSGPGRRRNFRAVLSGLTNNPTHGPTAQVGATLSASAEDFTAGTPATLIYQWFNSGGAIVGATDSTYEPSGLEDLTQIYCRISPSGYTPAHTEATTVRRAPPVSLAALDTEIFDLGTGPQFLDCSIEFSGADLSFSISGGDATIDTSTGIATIPTDTATEGAIVDVTAANSGGSETRSFIVVVENAPSEQTITFGALTLAGHGGEPKPFDANAIANSGGTNLVLNGSLAVPGPGGGVSSGILTWDDGTTWTVETEADTYSIRPDSTGGGELAAVLALGASVVSGKSIKGRTGDQLWIDGTLNNLGLTEETVITSHSDTDRFNFIGDTNKELRNPNHLTFDGVDFLWTFNKAIANDAGAAITVKGAFGNFKVVNCLMDGGYREAELAYGPSFFSSEYGWRGMFGQDGTTDVTGPFEILDCTIQNTWRGLNLPGGAGVGRFERNLIRDFTVDAMMLGGASPNGRFVRWNTLQEPRTITPPEVAVLSVDAANDRMTVDSDRFGASGTVTINMSGSTVAMPGGVNLPGVGGANDYACTIVSVSGGQTVLQFPVNITSPGSNVFIRAEPAHADMIQAVPGAGADVNHLEIVGNLVFGPQGSDGTWPQGIFLEDIASSGVPGYYDDTILAGNYVFSGVVHGINLYNSRRGVQAHNTVVTAPNGADVEPRILLSSHWGFEGENNLQYNNAAAAVATEYTDVGDIRTANHELSPVAYAASGLFAGTGGYDPSTATEFLAAFARQDFAGTLDLTNRIADLEAINAPSAINFADEVDVSLDSTIISAAVQVTSVTAYTGGASAVGALVSVHGGTNAQFRITSDPGGSSVVTDWTATPAIIEAGEYLWVQQDSSASNGVQTDVLVRVGRATDTFSVTTTAGDVAAPVLSLPTGAKNGSTGATSLGVTTDEGNGTLYWGIYPTASTPSAADIVAGTGATVSGSQAVSSSGVQAVSDQTGLTAGTAYKAHYVQDDAASNRSNVQTSAEFTTDAAGGTVVADYTFASGLEGWVASAGHANVLVTHDAGAGELEMDQNGDAWSGADSPAFTPVQGNTYRITVWYSAGAGTGDFGIRNATTDAAVTSIPSGERATSYPYSYAWDVLVASSADIYVRCNIRGSGGGTLSVDRVLIEDLGVV